MILVVLLVLILAWSVIGELDIVARADGKLVPQTRLQIVQPFEGGRIADILVKEGELVHAGQALVLMDTSLSIADTKILASELETARLNLLRIQAQLTGAELTNTMNADPVLFEQVNAIFEENIANYKSALREQVAVLEQVKQSRAAAKEIRDKLHETLPIYIENEKAVEKLVADGYANRNMLLEKQRERIEVQRDLNAKRHEIESLDARIVEAQAKVERLQTEYRRILLEEQSDLLAKMKRIEQEFAKQQYRNNLMELRAPQDGYVQDIGTHTKGAVVPAGSVVMNIVPVDDPLLAEVYLDHKDVGFVGRGQKARLKLAAFEFQRYGMVDATVETISQDAISDIKQQEQIVDVGYRGYLELETQYLERDGVRFALRPGMRVVAEINVGTRSALDFVLSPIQRAVSEAGTER